MLRDAIENSKKEKFRMKNTTVEFLVSLGNHSTHIIISDICL